MDPLTYLDRSVCCSNGFSTDVNGRLMKTLVLPQVNATALRRREREFYSKISSLTAEYVGNGQ
jgi:hypothetical protein